MAESGEHWDALTAWLAVGPWGSAEAEWSALVFAGVVVPGSMPLADFATLIAYERGHEITGPTSSSRIRRALPPGVASGLASAPDPFARRASRERFVLRGAAMRACGTCGRWSKEVWTQGKCSCGAVRLVPRPDETITRCAGCTGSKALAARFCEACGRVDAAAAGEDIAIRIRTDEAILAVVGDGEYVAGRAEDADIRLGRFAATAHARISVVDGEVFVEDLGSPSGVLVDGATIRGRAPWPDGVRARVGTDEIVHERLVGRDATIARANQGASRVEPTSADDATITRTIAIVASGLESAGEDLARVLELLPAIEVVLALVGGADTVVQRALGGALHHRLADAVAVPRAFAARFGAMFAHADFARRLEAIASSLASLTYAAKASDARRIDGELRTALARWWSDASQGASDNANDPEMFSFWKGQRIWFTRFRMALEAAPARGDEAEDAFLARVEAIAAAVRPDDDHDECELARNRIATWIRTARASRSGG